MRSSLTHVAELRRSRTAQFHSSGSSSSGTSIGSVSSAVPDNCVRGDNCAEDESLTYTALRQVFSTNEEGVKKKAFKKDKRKVSAIWLDMITHRFIEKWMWKDEFMAKKKAWRKKCR